MTIYIGENIKKLRRERGLTQESLAEFLGVTFQSVSNWERGESYPDITILPEIAEFFKVSTDSLLGINKTLSEKKISEYISLYETTRHKDTTLTFENFKKAVKEFPSDFRILVRYMELLMCEKTDKDNPEYEKVSRELLTIYKNIQEHCTDDNIRMWAKRLICQHLHTKAYYTDNNEYQLQAEKLIDEMPSMINSKEYLSTMLISDKPRHYEACSKSIEENLFLLENSVTHHCYYDDSFSPEYKIEAINKMLKITDTIYTDGNYGKLWRNVIYNYGHLIYLYDSVGDNNKALKSFYKCAELAKKFDTLPECSIRTSQFFENTAFIKTEYAKTMCSRMKYLIGEKYTISDSLRQDENFISVFNSL